MSENIPYIIAENGYYYVAYKEKVKVPELVVSAKGIANGLSEEYNDGWDFGPDSYSPTSTSAIPYTQTSGVEEALDYEATNYKNGVVELLSSDGDVHPFQINTDILFPNTRNAISLTIRGQGRTGGSILQFNSGCDKGIDYGANYNGNFDGNANLEKLTLFANTSTLTSLVNIPSSTNGGYVQLVDVQYSAVGALKPTYSDAAIYIDGVSFVSLVRCADEQGEGNGVSVLNGGHVRITDYRGAGSIVLLQGNNYVLFDNKSGTPLTLTNNGYVHITGQNDQGSTANITGGSNNIIKIDGAITLSGTPMFNIESGAVVNAIIADNAALANNTTGTSFLTNSGTLKYFSRKNMQFGNTDASSTVFPDASSTSGTTAGTVQMQASDYEMNYKKYVITFSTYENDTTTNQTIDFPLAFSSYAGISLNTTGLTISATTSGITITAPDATTTYSGIVIVEGY